MMDWQPNRPCWTRWPALALLLFIVLAAPTWAGAPPDPLAARESRLEQIKNSTGLLAIIGGVVLTAVGSVAAMLLAAARSPERVLRAERAVRRGPWVTLLVGVLSIGMILLVGTLLTKAAQAGAPGLAGLLVAMFLGVLVWLGAYGLAGTAKIIGQRLLKDDEGGQPLWRLVGAGALVIGGIGLLPFLGQFVFLFFFCRGVGAATLTLFSGASDPPT